MKQLNTGTHVDSGFSTAAVTTWTAGSSSEHHVHASIDGFGGVCPDAHAIPSASITTDASMWHGALAASTSPMAVFDGDTGSLAMFGSEETGENWVAFTLPACYHVTAVHLHAGHGMPGASLPQEVALEWLPGCDPHVNPACLHEANTAGKWVTAMTYSTIGEQCTDNTSTTIH